MKKALISVAWLVVGVAALTTLAGAHPATIKCPIDGGPMTFDHQVGAGKDAVCWYSHHGCDPQHPLVCGKHEAYVNCNDSPW